MCINELLENTIMTPKMRKIYDYLNPGCHLSDGYPDLCEQYELMESFSPSVRKMVSLVEERGVSTSKYAFLSNIVGNRTYNKIIEKRENNEKFDNGTFNLTINKLKDGEIVSERHTFKTENFKFIIPPEDTKRVDFIENLTIRVSVKNILVPKDFDAYEIENATMGLSPGGYIEVDKTNRLTPEGKLNKQVITCNVICVNDSPLMKMLEFIIHHELNHCYEQWQRLKGLKNKGYELKDDEVVTITPSQYKQFAILERSSNTFAKAFGYIMYWLYSKTEMNSNVNSVYRELAALNSKRQFFAFDLKKLTAYKRYEEIMGGYNKDNGNTEGGYLNLLKNCNNSELWGKFADIMGKKDWKSFKMWLINMVNRKAIDFFHKITKSASKYYDDTEPLKEQKYYVY